MNPGSQRGIRITMGILGVCGVLVLAVALVALNLSPVIVLGLALGGIALPVFVLRPEVGLHLFIVLIFFESLGEADKTVTVGKVAGFLILGSWLLRVALTRRLNLRVNGLVIGILGLVGWSALGITSAYNSDVAIRQTLTYLQLAVAMLMFAGVVDSPEKLRRMLRTIVLCTTLAAVHGLATYALGYAATTAGVLVNRNIMGNYAAFAIACAYILYQASGSGVERLTMSVAIPTLFVTLALTFSRTGVIEAGVIIAVLGFHLARQHGYLLLGGTLVMLLVISVTLPAKFYARVESIGTSMQYREETVGQRVELAMAGVRMIEAHPFIGVGAGNFPEVLNRYGRSGYTLNGHWASHNTFVGIAAESGLPALAFFVAAMTWCFRSLWATIRFARRGATQLGLLAIALQASLVGMLVSGVSNNQEKTKFLYIFLGLILSLGEIRRRMEATTPLAEAGARVPVLTMPMVPTR